jgi:hypothetical protein
MQDREKLFVAQAFMNAVGDMCKTKDPDNLRGRVSEDYVREYERMVENGLKRKCESHSFPAVVNGSEVGYLTVKVSKPTESMERVDVFVANQDAFVGSADYDTAIRIFAERHLGDVARAYFEETGAVPEGCEAQTYVVAGSPGGEVTGTALRIDSAKVAEALGDHLPEAAMLLLEGGSDD